MANAVIDLPGPRTAEREVCVEVPSTAAARESRILAANAVIQHLVPTFGTLIKSVAFPALILLLLALNFSAVSRVVEELPAMASRLNSFEAAGFKAQLVTAERVKPALKDLVDVSIPEVVALIKGLAPEQFDRLLYVGQTTESCLFSRATPNMLRFVAIDYELRDMKLLEISDAPDLVERLGQERRKAAQDHSHDIGDPISCYRFKLTELGSHVKTSLVRVVSRTFDARVDLR